MRRWEEEGKHTLGAAGLAAGLAAALILTDAAFLGAAFGAALAAGAAACHVVKRECGCTSIEPFFFIKGRGFVEQYNIYRKQSTF